MMMTDREKWIACWRREYREAMKFDSIMISDEVLLESGRLTGWIFHQMELPGIAEVEAGKAPIDANAIMGEVGKMLDSMFG